VFVAGVQVVDAFGSDDRVPCCRGSRDEQRAPQLRDTAANAADLDTTQDSNSSDRVAHTTTTVLQQVGRRRGSWCCARV
jgi:hypothetical protein